MTADKFQFNFSKSLVFVKGQLKIHLFSLTM